MSRIKPDIAVNQEKCIKCGACMELCLSAEVFKRINGRVEAVSPERCWQCGQCVAACPRSAVLHSGFTLEECPTVSTHSVSIDDMTAIFRSRRSLRVFCNKPVERDKVEKLIDISRWVPSAQNEQSVDWLAIDDPERIKYYSRRTVEALLQTAKLVKNPLLRPFISMAVGKEQMKKALESINELDGLAKKQLKGKDLVFYNAPVVLVAHVPKGSYFGRDNVVYAAYNLMLAAQKMNLGTCQIGFFNVALDRSRTLRKELGLPSDRQAELTLVLGYPEYGYYRTVPRRKPEVVWNAVK